MSNLQLGATGGNTGTPTGTQGYQGTTVKLCYKAVQFMAILHKALW